MKQKYELKKLSNVFNVKSSKRVHKKDWRESGVPFYRAREVVKLSQQGYVDNQLFISSELYAEFIKDKGAPKEGDIIISAVGTLGKCYLVQKGDIFYFKDASVLWFEKNSQIDSKYVEYAFMSDLILSQVMHKSMGATVGTLTIDRAKNIEIPIPSLSEQMRIVKILDEVFEKIDKAKENDEKNLQNTRELFESYLQSVFIPPSVGWKYVRLDNLATLISGQHIDAKNYNSNSKGVGYLTGPSDFCFINPVVTKWTEHPKRMALQGDILITVKGSGVGKVNLLDIPEVAISRQLMAVRVTGVDVGYLYAFLTTKFNYFQSLANGAAIPGVSRGDVLNLMCPLPPLGQQKNIVKLIHAMSKQTQHLEVNFQEKIKNLEELKKSILQKAFNGELTGTQA